MLVSCPNCAQPNEVPDAPKFVIHGAVAVPQAYTCWNCQAALPAAQPPLRQNSESVAVGLLGGAVLGGAIAGPVGAVVGSVLGALIGSKAAT